MQSYEDYMLEEYQKQLFDDQVQEDAAREWYNFIEYVKEYMLENTIFYAIIYNNISMESVDFYKHKHDFMKFVNEFKDGPIPLVLENNGIEVIERSLSVYLEEIQTKPEKNVNDIFDIFER